MTLTKWIIKMDPKILAKKMNVDPSTVSQWRTRKICPRPRHMVLIHKLSKGEVTYKDMVEGVK